LKTLENLPVSLRERLRRVRLLLLDVDGVLTDGFIYLDDHGTERKRFSVRDGLAVWWVRKFGLLTGVISGRSSPATELRCRDLAMDEVHTGQPRKLPVLEGIMTRRGLAAEQIAYIGDDVVDLSVLTHVGVCAAPSDAHPEVLKRVDLVLDYPGGGGAVRQFIEIWLMACGHWESAMEDVIRGNI
jgi:3-deoxy-D-manno-octulosonate 8-phosphate phosphatase (KDO 8-P phosphatase)